MSLVGPIKPPEGSGSGGGSGEINLGANVGVGDAAIFRDKTGVTLNFKRLVAGTNVTLTDNADTVEIDSAASGEANDAANVGAGTGQIYRDKTGTTINLKTLVAGSNVSLTNNADTITIAATDTGEVNTASNVGTGDGELFAGKSGVDLQFKTLVAGDNVNITNNANDVEIDVTIPTQTTVYEWSTEGYVYPSNIVYVHWSAPFNLEITAIKVFCVEPHDVPSEIFVSVETNSGILASVDANDLTAYVNENLVLDTLYTTLSTNEVLYIIFDYSSASSTPLEGIRVQIIYEST